MLLAHHVMQTWLHAPHAYLPAVLLAQPQQFRVQVLETLHKKAPTAWFAPVRLCRVCSTPVKGADFEGVQSTHSHGKHHDAHIQTAACLRVSYYHRSDDMQ
jgi:hypothetical protein